MTEHRRTSGGVPVPSPTLVQCDQLTVLGDGSHDHPLHAATGSTGTSFAAASRDGLTTLGSPVTVYVISVPGGITTVQGSQVSPISPAFDLLSSACGLISAHNGDGTVEVTTSGILTLTTAQWDTVTGDSGGLLPGVAYYVSPDRDAITGLPALTQTPPVAAGAYRVQVGVALTPLVMLVTPRAPYQVLGDQIVFPQQLFGSVNVGSVVQGGVAVASLASNSGAGSAGNAQVLGICVSTDPAIVQFAGVVALTTGQWDAVTGGSGGLTTGATYYLSTNPGLLTTVAPTTTGYKVQLGVAASATELAISPYLQLLP